MLKWYKIKDRPPDLSGKPIMIGRHKSAGAPAAMAGIYDGHDYLAYGPFGLIKFKNPTHWAHHPEPPKE